MADKDAPTPGKITPLGIKEQATAKESIQYSRANVSGRPFYVGSENVDRRKGTIGGILEIEGKWYGLTVLSPFIEDPSEISRRDALWRNLPSDVSLVSNNIYDSEKPGTLWGHIPLIPDSLKVDPRYYSPEKNWALVELTSQSLSTTRQTPPRPGLVLLPAGLTITDDEPLPCLKLVQSNFVKRQSVTLRLPYTRASDISGRYYTFKCANASRTYAGVRNAAHIGGWLVDIHYLTVAAIIQHVTRTITYLSSADDVFGEIKERFPGLKPPLITTSLDCDEMGCGYFNEEESGPSTSVDLPYR
ncbi:uncharacterized protein BO97DRAFT_409840 [Aspergillus homomorphus CBS 101889]|uniref:Uncharacterized protein n=1 Tax=Aspergillus homomorphus (strain CBS 101889) TaxID=1450537 RepID=A0A395IE18_ASPHC|nr:hypothetical protein BO97DRAFT_409840 [Aspergillus homomorphus CBS 101889]RAL17403.1 hypothetical protein BO97DRAFT_409840 [Aspergillus homomorphus CBS 101889]